MCWQPAFIPITTVRGKHACPRPLVRGSDCEQVPQTIQILGLCSVLSLAEPLPTWTATALRRICRSTFVELVDASSLYPSRCLVCTVLPGHFTKSPEGCLLLMVKNLHMCVSMHVILHVCLVCLYVFMSLCVSAYICVCYGLCLCVHVYVCTCLCVCLCM